MTRPPLVFRLMLGTLFLPIILALGVLWYSLWFHAPEVWSDQSLTLGLPFRWLMLALFGLPFLLWLWILWSGKWRRPVLAAAIVYFGTLFIAAFQIVTTHTPPDKRIIHIGNRLDCDVYCNGVHLGRTPLKIRVDELKSKVPEWDTPPEQRWYDDAEPNRMLFTWFPWDDFRKDRFEASKELFGANTRQVVSNTPRALKARRDALNKHDADCRYWWSMRQGDSRLAFYRSENPYYLNTPFERTGSYTLGASGWPFSPSAPYHAELLADVLPELTPEQKSDWDRHVLKHCPQIDNTLGCSLDRLHAKYKKRDENGPLAKLYEKALESTIRLKHGLSDPPTEDECRRFLEECVADSIERGTFSFLNMYNIGLNDGQPSCAAADAYFLIPGKPMLGDAIRRPLVEQWRKNRYRYENGWAPVAYFSGLDQSPDYFADFVRYSATTHNARLGLLINEDPRAATLFKTLLYRKTPANWMTRDVLYYPKVIDLYNGVANPRTEADFRQYIVDALSDPEHDESTRATLDKAVFGAIYLRILMEEVDKEELAAWVASLPMKPSFKRLALRMLRIRGNKAETFADRLQQAAGQRALIETDLTLDDVTQWFNAHPDANLQQFFVDHEESITVGEVFEQTNQGVVFTSLTGTTSGTTTLTGRNADGEFSAYPVWSELPKCFLLTLLRSDPPEGDPKVQAVVKQLWQHDPAELEQAISTEYGAYNLFASSSFNNVSSIHLPDYILDLFEEYVESAKGGIESFLPATTLVLCDAPRAGAILEKWADKASTTNKPRIERCREIWQIRDALRRKRMELFHDLIAGRITPDDLLLRQPPWIWEKGRYRQND